MSRKRWTENKANSRDAEAIEFARGLYTSKGQFNSQCCIIEDAERQEMDIKPLVDASTRFNLI